MKTIAIVLVLASCSKPSHQREIDGWSAVRIGSVFESETVTRLQRPFAHETTGTIEETLVARNDSEASVRIALSDGSARVVAMPLQSVEPQPCPGTTVTTAHELCTTPAGTFECTRTTVEVRQRDTTNSTVTWTAHAIPVPIKSIVHNDSLTTTTELVSIRE